MSLDTFLCRYNQGCCKVPVCCLRRQRERKERGYLALRQEAAAPWTPASSAKSPCAAFGGRERGRSEDTSRSARRLPPGPLLLPELATTLRYNVHPLCSSESK